MSTIPSPQAVTAAGQQATNLLAQNGHLAPVDLVGMRQARWEAAGRKQVIWVDGPVDLVPELPIEVGSLLMEGQVREAIAMLLLDPAPEAIEAFMRGRPTVEDLDEITKLYGVEPGEVSASPGS